MALRDDIAEIIQYHRDNAALFTHNTNIFDIMEGELLPQVLADLKKQLSANSYETIKHRVPPINVLIRIIDKLSTIYEKPPIRTIKKGTKRVQKDLGELLSEMDFDSGMSEANRFLNAFKSTWVEPFLHQGKPRLRAIPPDRFFVFSKDPVDPTVPTHFIKIMGQNAEKETVYWAYTADEFLIFDGKGKVDIDAMNKMGNEGVNQFGALPGVYINRSLHCLVPKPDTDVLQMTKLIPILLADCNFAVMFQAFSIIYGIDVDDKNLTMSPNAFWSFKSQPAGEGGLGADTKPSIGVIKPELDSEKALNVVTTQLAMWLESKGIKPGSVGTMTVENAASGVAKMIDEADTTADRKKQVKIFAPKDSELIECIANHMLPVWQTDTEFESEVILPSNLKLKSEFPEQKPLVDEGAATNTQKTQLEAKLTTRTRAIKKLNPDMTDDEVEELKAEIDQEAAENQAAAIAEAEALGGDPTDPKDPNAPPTPIDKKKKPPMIAKPKAAKAA